MSLDQGQSAVVASRLPGQDGFKSRRKMYPLNEAELLLLRIPPPHVGGYAA